jgi:hypothetical protein
VYAYPLGLVYVSVMSCPATAGVINPETDIVPPLETCEDEIEQVNVVGIRWAEPPKAYTEPSNDPR